MRQRLACIAMSFGTLVACGGQTVIDPYPECESRTGKSETCEGAADYGNLCERDAQCVEGVSCSTPDGWSKSICALDCSAVCPQDTECAEMLGYCVPKCTSHSDCRVGLACFEGLCQTLLTDTVTQEEVPD